MIGVNNITVGKAWQRARASMDWSNNRSFQLTQESYSFVAILQAILPAWFSVKETEIEIRENARMILMVRFMLANSSMYFSARLLSANDFLTHQQRGMMVQSLVILYDFQMNSSSLNLRRSFPFTFTSMLSTFSGDISSPVFLRMVRPQSPPLTSLLWRQIA